MTVSFKNRKSDAGYKKSQNHRNVSETRVHHFLKPWLVALAGCFIASLAYAKTYTKDELMKKGEEQYGQHCLLCHKDNGQGVPNVFPALVGSPIATGPVEDHIKLVLHGKKGTAMITFANQLNDLQIASIVTYERNSWGNDNRTQYGNNAGGIVQPEDVAKLRKP